YRIQLLYTFFISDEVRFGAMKRTWLVTYSLVSLFFCWQIPVQIVCLTRDETLLEAIGFFSFFGALLVWILFNGIKFVQGMKTSQKKNKMKHFDRIIFKTKVLLWTAAISVTIIVAHDIIFNYVLEKEYRFFPLETFMTMFVDVGQMIVVMVIMADRSSLLNYILFRRTRNAISTGNSTEENSNGMSVDLSKKYDHSSNMESSSSMTVDLETTTSYSAQNSRTDSMNSGVNVGASVEPIIYLGSNNSTADN
ncbi:hypothetical protein SAMD00019534_095130, partial [Acytostelium subglobosum LB1]|uniref:hypothetical protein n=1 Tax=Acytostelium subglobosum LB1 TaxID=1410327 RepID=UPI0006450A6F